MALGTYDEQILGAKQQAETARKLREGITDPQGQMVSGWYVAPSITQHIANALKSYVAYQKEGAANDQAKTLQGEKQAKYSELLKSIPTERDAPVFQAPNQATAQQVMSAPSDADMLRQMSSGQVDGSPQPQSMAFKPQEPDAAMLSQALRGQSQAVPVQTGTQHIVPTDADRMAWTMQAAQVDPNLAQIGMSMQEKELARQQAMELARQRAEESQRSQAAQFQQQNFLAREAAKDRATLAYGLQSSKPEKMVTVIDPSSQQPISVPQSQMNGALPYTPANMAAIGKDKAKAQMSDTVGTLLNHYENLHQGGGITDTNASGISNLMTGNNVIGQALGRAFGTKNQTERDSIEQMRPELMATMMKATGMSAQQVNSEGELKMWMKTMTDPNSSIQAAREAAYRIDKKYGQGKVPKYETQPSTPGQPAPLSGGAKFLGFE